MSQEELLMLSQRDRDRVRVIHQVLEGRLSQVDGAEQLGLTARHVRRLVKRLAKRGDGGLIHQSRGKPSHNRFDGNFRRRVLRRYKSRYSDFGPPHFQRNLSTGRQAQLQVIADGRNSNTAALAIGYVNEILNQFNANFMATHSTGTPPPAELQIRAWFNPDLLSRWQIVPAMIGLITMLAVMILTAMSVAREREQGTFDQLLVAPFTPLEIMAGKVIPPIVVGLGQSAVIFLIVRYWFQVPYFGTPEAIILTFVIFIIAAAGLGLLVSSISSTMQQALLGTFVMVMPCALLSGLATPVSNMPRAVQDITLINPLRYDVQAAREAFLEGANVHQLLPELIPMAIIAIASLLTASWLFRRIQ